MERTFSQTYLVRQAALPSEHGAWVFLLSPLLIGLFAGGRLTTASLYLIVAALAAFLIRQPLTIATKTFSGRRSRRDLPASLFWMSVYALIGLAALTGLIWLGFGYLLVLALPGAPVFIWHLYLVSQRAERRQLGVELVGSGVLALAAPAAYWVGLGRADAAGWWLFALAWLQSAASIVYAYLRLEQRELKSIPSTQVKLGMARRALLYTGFNTTLALVFGAMGLLPAWIFLPYLLQFAETVWGSINPAVGYKPTTIGFRQLAVSSLFTLVFILTWQIG